MPIEVRLEGARVGGGRTPMTGAGRRWRGAAGQASHISANGTGRLGLAGNRA